MEGGELEVLINVLIGYETLFCSHETLTFTDFFFALNGFVY